VRTQREAFEKASETYKCATLKKCNKEEEKDREPSAQIDIH